MTAKSDPGNYGKMLAIIAPQGQQVLGPVQAAANIQKNTDISSEITLLSQQGSRVIAGNVQLIPVGRSIVYVQPFFTVATNNPNPFPQFQFVATLVPGHSPTKGQTVTEALGKLFGNTPITPGTPSTPARRRPRRHRGRVPPPSCSRRRPSASTTPRRRCAAATSAATSSSSPRRRTSSPRPASSSRATAPRRPARRAPPPRPRPRRPPNAQEAPERALSAALAEAPGPSWGGDCRAPGELLLSP